MQNAADEMDLTRQDARVIHEKSTRVSNKHWFNSLATGETPMPSRFESAVPSDAPFRSWSYMEARQHLWPSASLGHWNTGELPPDACRLPIDKDITALKMATGGRAPKLRARPPSARKLHRLLQALELVPFCPYREVRAHWIPFALQVARIETDHHQSRNESHDEAVHDIEKVISALKRYCRHDFDALAQFDRPILARFSDRRTQEDRDYEFENAPWSLEGAGDDILAHVELPTDPAPLHGPMRSMLSRYALDGAQDALSRIETFHRLTKPEFANSTWPGRIWTNGGFLSLQRLASRGDA